MEDEIVSNLPYPTYVCEFCRPENASWLSASVHCDCFNSNSDGFGHKLPKSERECMCDCAYA